MLIPELLSRGTALASHHKVISQDVNRPPMGSIALCLIGSEMAGYHAICKVAAA